MFEFIWGSVDLSALVNCFQSDIATDLMTSIHSKECFSSLILELVSLSIIHLLLLTEAVISSVCALLLLASITSITF